MNLSDELKKLRSADPDVALLLDHYSQTRQVYREVLEAMGRGKQIILDVQNSADVVLHSTSDSPLTSDSLRK